MKMKRITTRYCVLALVVGILPLIAGCFSFRDPETLDIAAGAGIDFAENGFYELTTEVLDISAESASKIQADSMIVESRGQTMSDAVNDTITRMRQKVYWADAQIVVFSEDVARQGIEPIIDWMLRDAEPRANLYLAVSRAGSAQALFKPTALGTELRSFALARILDNADVNLGETSIYRLYEVANMIHEESHAVTMPAFHITTNQGKEQVELSGTAIFEGDRLIGYLNGDESKYLNVIRNEIDTGIFTFTVPGSQSEKGILSVEIYELDTKCTPILTDSGIAISIKTKGKVAVNNNMTKEPAGKDTTKKFENDICQAMKQNMESVIGTVQQKYGSDIFGFGTLIYRDMPNYWKQNGEHWPALFKTLPIQVECDITIARNGLWSPEKGD